MGTYRISHSNISLYGDFEAAKDKDVNLIKTYTEVKVENEGKFGVKSDKITVELYDNGYAYVALNIYGATKYSSSSSHVYTKYEIVDDKYLYIEHSDYCFYIYKYTNELGVEVEGLILLNKHN
mgnify:CR=1 FL=1